MSLELLIQIMHVFNNDIGMEAGVEKYEVLTLKKGQVADNDGTVLQNKTTVKD